MLIPDRLVTVRRYLVPEMAEDDLGALTEAEIPAYVRPLGRNFQLVVPENLRERALEILPPVKPDTDPDDDFEACPNCDSRLRALGDLDGVLLLAALVAAAWMAWNGHPGQGALLFAAGALAIRVLASRRAAWECGNCRARFSVRELDAARAERERHSID